MCSCCAQIQCHLRREDSQGVEGAEASQSYQQSQRIKGKTHAQFAWELWAWVRVLREAL